MLKGLTNTFKNGCNNVEVEYKEYIKLENNIIPVKAELQDDSYENGNFVGTFIFKQIIFETDATYEFRNKEFEYYKVVNGESIKIGTFISTDITINDTTEIVRVVGMDYGLKTQVEYTSALDYASGEITLKDVWNECCQLSGLESGIDDFPNSDFIVDSDQFSGTGATIRDVYKGIAMSSGTFVKVMNDDKIYLLFNEHTNELEEVEIDESGTIEDGYEMDSLELQGDTYQKTTTGKNLFDYYTYPTSETVNGITCTNNGDGTITLNGTSTGNNFGFQLGRTSTIQEYSVTQGVSLTQTAYYISGTCTKGETSTSNRTVLRLDYNHSGSFIKMDQLNSTNNVISKTMPSRPSSTSFAWQINIGLGDVFNNFTIKYQLEVGSQATEWEEYTNGASPNPDFPQNIEVVTGRQEIDVVGKNLFDKDNANILNNMYIDGTTSTIKSANGGKVLYIPCELNTTYTISKILSARFTVGTTNVIPEENAPIYNRITNNQATHITITTDSSSKYLCVFYYTSSYDTLTEEEIRNSIQIEKSSTASEYEEYKGQSYEINLGNIELCKIGDYKDRIYKDNDKWYIEKNIDKIILDGSEGWATSSSGTSSWNYRINIPTKVASGIGISTHYPRVYISSTNTTQGFNIAYATATTGQVRIRYGTEDTIENFKAWLSTHNVVVYYGLGEPKITEITDSELISQLESIELLEGLNNISIISSDLTGKLKLFYYNNNFDIIEDYVELEDKRDTHPWTCLRLGMSNIDGENVDYIDQELVEQYGENWLILNDNPFAYNQEKRQQLIVAIFNQIKEFGYSSFVSKIAFKPYLTSGDIIQFRNRDKELVKSIILRYTHDGEEITLEAPSETSATVNYIYPLGAIDIAKQTQIIVDQDRVRIDSLTSQTQTMQDDLRQNYYTLEQTNQLVQTASTGLTNTFSEAGGNNIFRNTGLWFATSDSNNPYEFWNGVVVKQKEEKASNMSAMLLQNGNVSQEQLVPNGKYTISFKYNKPVLLATAKIYINDTEYVLNETTDTEFTEVIEVSSQHINIRFNCDVNNGCEIYDLMVNAGEVKLAYSQNQNETTTDTVNISKGITITSSDIDVKFKADADGIRTLDKNNNELTKFTDTGMKTKTAIIESKSQIVGTLWQEVGNQTWITRL